MQERHNNRRRYFEELADTCANFFIPYIKLWHEVAPGMSILEVGCGEGGNLLPFSKIGCDVTGIDIASGRIDEAKRFFKEKHARGKFIAEDFLELKVFECRYDIILCHDVLEHINDKEKFLSRIGCFLKEDGIVFMSFPAWQMPFGGHQQICRNRILSHLPFVHLLPKVLYRGIIRLAGESDACLNELLYIRRTRITIEAFERLVSQTDLTVLDRTLYLINPHYKVKFGLKPSRLTTSLSSVPYLRDFFCSSCFYILKKGDKKEGWKRWAQLLPSDSQSKWTCEHEWMLCPDGVRIAAGGNKPVECRLYEQAGMRGEPVLHAQADACLPL